MTGDEKENMSIYATFCVQEAVPELRITQRKRAKTLAGNREDLGKEVLFDGQILAISSRVEQPVAYEQLKGKAT